MLIKINFKNNCIHIKQIIKNLLFQITINNSEKTKIFWKLSKKCKYKYFVKGYYFELNYNKKI